MPACSAPTRRTPGEQWRARVGVVLQPWRYHAKWRVREPLRHLVGLPAQASTRIAKLSGGQRRRLDVAIGIVVRPELLFLDEPTTGFDPAARREFHELVHRAWRWRRRPQRLEWAG
jgi:ABC-2 type transport system ATP-binding protein